MLKLNSNITFQYVVEILIKCIDRGSLTYKLKLVRGKRNAIIKKTIELLVFNSYY